MRDSHDPPGVSGSNDTCNSSYFTANSRDSTYTTVT